MLKSRGRLTAVMLAVALTFATAPTASAASGSWRDAAGDAPRAFDIRQFGMGNDPESVFFALEVANLKDRSYTAWFYFSSPQMDEQEAFFLLESTRLWDGSKRLKLYFAPGGGADWMKVNCAGMASSWKLRADRMWAGIPQPCLGTAVGDQSFFAELTKGGSQKPIDDTSMKTVAYG